ncbi:NUDIX domain-containing protein [Jonesia denitrificans]|uniref:NUDIX domain-containing protein n=1 Tax=Jonesia denitrificans TaxID=43674 RepID=UPI001D00AF41|nr:NUDIX hydrolase [Jonesia denitrificans]
MVTLDDNRRPTHVVLQHRALWSHHGGTWGIPGGAIMEHETPHQGALREAREEAGIDPDRVTIVGTHIFEHPQWSYTTAIAVARTPFLPVQATDMESLDVQWFALDDLTSVTPSVELLPSFARSLPVVLTHLDDALNHTPGS